MEIEEIRKSIAEKYKSKYNKDISNKELTDIFIR
jgi:aspartate/methionine/tyrosine aminotransferase